jgi:tRNA(fMet)-specific endonuclease VapC
MIAFDTDVLTGIMRGNPNLIARLEEIPLYQQTVPVIVIEEIIRGRLNVIRQAEAGKAKISITYAYTLFEMTFQDFQRLPILSYTAEADAIFQEWRRQKIRVSTHDMRIGAISIVHQATLVSRNRKDYERLPGLQVEYWM